jgi:hypothetical protein
MTSVLLYYLNYRGGVAVISISVTLCCYLNMRLVMFENTDNIEVSDKWIRPFGIFQNPCH